MSDPTGWHAPSGSAPQPPQYGAPGYGAAGGAPGYGMPGWTPPPKPGLIPLRPLGFGQLLGVPFQVLRRNPKASFGASLIIEAAVVLGALLITGGVTALVVSRIAMASDADRDAITAGGVAAVVVAALVSAALAVVGAALLQGIIVLEVAHGALGQKLRGIELWRATRGARGALIGYILLLLAAFALVAAVLAGVIAGIVALARDLWPLAVVVGVFGLLGFAVLAVFFGTRLSLVPSAVVLERGGLRGGIARSWMLTRGAFWRTFGAQLIVNAICSVAAQIIQTPIALLYSFAIGALAPFGVGGSSPTGGQLALAIGSYGLLLLVSLVIGSITQVVTAAVGGLIYLDQRMRREGLDLVLARYVEDRQAGRPVGDPFRTAPVPAASGYGPYPPSSPYGNA